MLQLQNVHKSYRKGGQEVAALAATSLEVGAGEYVALVGPSGSGKTTLLSILGGMLAPTAGQVWLDGAALYELSVNERTRLRCRKIGFVFQTFNLVPYLTALENVQVPLMLSGGASAEQGDRAESLLTRLGLKDRLHHKPSELSVGQQQRVALARTLANDPPIILADEPTGNLDPETREQILCLLDHFHADGRTIVMVTHDVAAASRAQKRLRLSNGSVIGVEGEPLLMKSA